MTQKNDAPQGSAPVQCSSVQAEQARRPRDVYLEGLSRPDATDQRRAVIAQRLDAMRADFAEAYRLRALRAWDAIAERVEAEG